MKSKSIILLITLSIVLSYNTLLAKDWQLAVRLSGFWKFTIGDDMDWADPDYNDNSWEEIRVPSSWEDEGFHGYNGYAWYRTTFEMPSDMNEYSLHLYLGFIDDVDEVYVNGKLIGRSGSFPPDYFTAYNSERSYPIPHKYLNKNNNVIAVRVFDSQLSGGIIRGDIGIYAYTGGMKLDLNLEGEWKFKTGDNLEWKNSNFNDTDWESIFVPGTWETRGWNDYDGFAWYRIKFFVPENYGDQKLIVVLGKIDDLDEAYLNGQLIGSTGVIKEKSDRQYFENEWQQFRGYFIPDDILKPGEENVLAVRVYDGYLNGGIYEGPIGMITQDKYRRYWKEQKRNRNFWDIFFGN